MSTDYKIFERIRENGETHSIEMLEHSSLLDIGFYASQEGLEEERVATFKNFTPEQIIDIALQMLKVASYQIDTDDFKKAIDDTVAKDKNGVGFVLDSIVETLR